MSWWFPIFDLNHLLKFLSHETSHLETGTTIYQGSFGFCFTTRSTSVRSQNVCFQTYMYIYIFSYLFIYLLYLILWNIYCVCWIPLAAFPTSTISQRSVSPWHMPTFTQPLGCRGSFCGVIPSTKMRPSFKEHAGETGVLWAWVFDHWV